MVFPFDQDKYILSSFGHDSPGPPPTPPSISLSEIITTLPTGSRWSIQRFDLASSDLLIAQALRDGTAIAVSDGSYKDHHGTSALILQAPQTQHNIIAVNTVPGNSAFQDSYRSEIAGIYGQLIMVNTLCCLHNITQGSIECGCNGMEAL
jgi:hypothetical protein